MAARRKCFLTNNPFKKKCNGSFSVPKKFRQQENEAKQKKHCCAVSPSGTVESTSGTEGPSSEDQNESTSSDSSSSEWSTVEQTRAGDSFCSWDLSVDQLANIKSMDDDSPGTSFLEKCCPIAASTPIINDENSESSPISDGVDSATLSEENEISNMPGNSTAIEKPALESNLLPNPSDIHAKNSTVLKKPSSTPQLNLNLSPIHPGSFTAKKTSTSPFFPNVSSIHAGDSTIKKPPSTSVLVPNLSPIPTENRAEITKPVSCISDGALPVYQDFEIEYIHPLEETTPPKVNESLLVERHTQTGSLKDVIAQLEQEALALKVGNSRVETTNLNETRSGQNETLPLISGNSDSKAEQSTEKEFRECVDTDSMDQAGGTLENENEVLKHHVQKLKYPESSDGNYTDEQKDLISKSVHSEITNPVPNQNGNHWNYKYLQGEKTTPSSNETSEEETIAAIRSFLESDFWPQSNNENLLTANELATASNKNNSGNLSTIPETETITANSRPSKLKTTLKILDLSNKCDGNFCNKPLKTTRLQENKDQSSDSQFHKPRFADNSRNRPDSIQGLFGKVGNKNYSPDSQLHEPNLVDNSRNIVDNNRCALEKVQKNHTSNSQRHKPRDKNRNIINGIRGSYGKVEKHHSTDSKRPGVDNSRNTVDDNLNTVDSNRSALRNVEKRFHSPDSQRLGSNFADNSWNTVDTNLNTVDNHRSSDLRKVTKRLHSPDSQRPGSNFSDNSRNTVDDNRGQVQNKNHRSNSQSHEPGFADIPNISDYSLDTLGKERGKSLEHSVSRINPKNVSDKATLMNVSDKATNKFFIQRKMLLPNKYTRRHTERRILSHESDIKVDNASKGFKGQQGKRMQNKEQRMNKKAAVLDMLSYGGSKCMVGYSVPETTSLSKSRLSISTDQCDAVSEVDQIRYAKSNSILRESEADLKFQRKTLELPYKLPKVLKKTHRSSASLKLLKSSGNATEKSGSHLKSQRKTLELPYKLPKVLKKSHKRAASPKLLRSSVNSTKRAGEVKINECYAQRKKILSNLSKEKYGGSSVGPEPVDISESLTNSPQLDSNSTSDVDDPYKVFPICCLSNGNEPHVPGRKFPYIRIKGIPIDDIYLYDSYKEDSRSTKNKDYPKAVN